MQRDMCYFFSASLTQANHNAKPDIDKTGSKILQQRRPSEYIEQI